MSFVRHVEQLDIVKKFRRFWLCYDDNNNSNNNDNINNNKYSKKQVRDKSEHKLWGKEITLTRYSINKIVLLECHTNLWKLT